jgi:ubiquinol-cytochrome c reductase iron-sulfur subunit
MITIISASSRSRTWLLRALLAILVSCAFALLWLLLRSLEPSEKVKAEAPTKVIDISELQPDQTELIEVFDKPVVILRRSKEQIAKLAREAGVKDTASLASLSLSELERIFRSQSPEYFVVVAISTHRGCSTEYRPKGKLEVTGWEGGFWDQCHGFTWDTAGQPLSQGVAPLALPRYRILQGRKVEFDLTRPNPTAETDARKSGARGSP